MFPGPLRTFYEVVRTGSLRKAGEILSLAPSSVSRQIALLEEEMGVPLFDRTVNGVTLTYAGTQVAEYARTVLRDYDSLRADLDAIRGVKRGLIRLATIEGSVSENAIAAVARFRDRHPGIRFQVRLLPAPRVVDAVRRGEVDVGLTYCGKPEVDLQFESHTHDPISLIVRPGDPLAAQASVTIDQLQYMPLALPETSFNIRQVLDEASQRKGFLLSPVLATDSFSAIRAFVQAGSGQGVLTRLAVAGEARLGLLRGIPIELPGVVRMTVDIVTLRNRRRSFVLTAFLAVLDEIMRNCADAGGQSEKPDTG